MTLRMLEEESEDEWWTPLLFQNILPFLVSLCLFANGILRSMLVN